MLDTYYGAICNMILDFLVRELSTDLRLHSSSQLFLMVYISLRLIELTHPFMVLVQIPVYMIQRFRVIFDIPCLSHLAIFFSEGRKCFIYIFRNL